MSFSFFAGGGHPYQPVQFPPPTSRSTRPSPTQQHPPTAQRPTPPANRIQLFGMGSGIWFGENKSKKATPLVWPFVYEIQIWCHKKEVRMRD
jgi:hypothetical protein